MAISGNKGEWSEIYTLFKVLGDKRLYSGSESLEKVEHLVYPIVKVLRSELQGNFEYTVDQDIVVISSDKQVLHRVSIQEFQAQALSLFEHVKDNHGSFSAPEAESFMRKIHCSSLKAASTVKTDITITIHDERTNQTPQLGFSIKSQLGNPSTLLNAGKTTNFKYEVVGKLSQESIVRINSIDSRSKIKDRIEAVHKLGGRFQFIATEQNVFSNNLVLIDSLLPQLLGHLVFEFYHSSHSKMIDLVKVLEQRNVLNFDDASGHQFYTYKIKRFLTDVALGMMPSKVWSGLHDATGGYLIVKENGDVLCYHIYNRNEFESYLLNNTKLDTASSSRHGFGVVFEEQGKLYMNLNLQIRFMK